MLAESLEGRTCEHLVERWGISPELAAHLMLLNSTWERHYPGLGSLSIISGYRTREEQQELEREGRPAAADHLSTHRSCPATGADLRIPLAVDDSTKVELGRLAQLSGLRWGGGSPPDVAGIPVDWNHVDLGPRR
jgi:uncharacterized protein YcbK (DUF882 family)